MAGMTDRQTVALLDALQRVEDRLTATNLQLEAANQHAVAMVNTQLRTNQLLEALVTQGSITRPAAKPTD